MAKYPKCLWIYQNQINDVILFCSFTSELTQLYWLQYRCCHFRSSSQPLTRVNMCWPTVIYFKAVKGMRLCLPWNLLLRQSFLAKPPRCSARYILDNDYPRNYFELIYSYVNKYAYIKTVHYILFTCKTCNFSLQSNIIQGIKWSNIDRHSSG